MKRRSEKKENYWGPGLTKKMRERFQIKTHFEEKEEFGISENYLRLLREGDLQFWDKQGKTSEKI